ncbi:MAG: tryptophan--tRNA ligase [Anaerolineales bacterium]
MKKPISLSGIKPSGTPHLGNYLGFIKPALEMVQDYQALYFIADYHALTTIRDGKTLRSLTYEIAATLLALGLDPDEVVIFRQSDVPELFELTWILNCFTPKGLMNRAHAYKAAVDQNTEMERDPDAGVNMGLYTYPTLMASDILLYGSEVVPVGQDQRQHVEITRDIALAFNHTYGDVLVVPEAVIQEDVASIPGLDGRKMSKSYDNVIPIFAPPKLLRKKIMQIVTDSSRPEDPKNPDADNVFNIYKYFATPEQVEHTRQRYLHGGLAYSEIKQELFEILEDKFSSARTTYDNFIANPQELDTILLEGAGKARMIGNRLMRKVRKAVGVRYNRELQLP